jgi:lipopolysaccharide transport system ATP-binding protein
MSTNTILKAENISKQYRLGNVGTKSLQHDLNRWYHRVRGKEDPYLQVGAVNDRSKVADGEYVWALKDINFEVQRGEVLGIIGKNGAGKSTLLKILSRVTSPTTGSIKTKGRIASLLEVGTGFHPELTGRENIYLNGAILGMSRSEITSKIDEIVEFSGCQMYIDTPTKRYSSGMTVRLAFAVAAHLEPDILVVDEVLAVGDAEFQKKAIGKMQDISSGEGRTVLFVSHNMASVQSLCSRAILLENGMVVFEGTAEQTVTHYLSKNKGEQSRSVILDKNHRRSDVSQEIKLERIELVNDEPTTRKALAFRIKAERANHRIQNFSITGSICSYDDMRIGSFFTQDLKISQTVFHVDLQIRHHNLAVGKYYLNVSATTGSIDHGNLKTLDHAYEAISFEILKEEDSGKFIVEWNTGWGKLFFESEASIAT